MIVSIASALALLLLQLLVPYRPKPLADYDKFILVNEYKYKIYEIFALVPLFFFISAICYFFYALGNDIQELIYADRVADFAIYPPDSFWLVPGLCFGFGLILPPMDLLYHLLLKEEYPAYLEYTNRKHGYDGYQVMRPLCLLFTVAGLVLSNLGLDWYTEIKGENIVIDEFYALAPREYVTKDLRSITQYEESQTAEGKRIKEPHYKINFSDGNVWDTSNNFSEVDYENYTAIATYLALKANLKIAYEVVDAEELVPSN
jgi:hypothetical protein